MRTLPSAAAGRDVPTWLLRKLVARPPELRPPSAARGGRPPFYTETNALWVRPESGGDCSVARARVVYSVIATRPACLAPRRRESVLVSSPCRRRSASSPLSSA